MANTENPHKVRLAGRPNGPEGERLGNMLSIVWTSLLLSALLSAWQMAWILFRSGIDKLNWERQRGPRRNVSGRFETHQSDSVLLISSFISVRYRAVKYLLVVVVV